MSGSSIKQLIRQMILPTAYPRSSRRGRVLRCNDVGRRIQHTCRWRATSGLVAEYLNLLRLVRCRYARKTGEQDERAGTVMHRYRDIVSLCQIDDAAGFADASRPGRIDHDIVSGLGLEKR